MVVSQSIELVADGHTGRLPKGLYPRGPVLKESQLVQ